jgi:hypothetical protein
MAHLTTAKAGGGSARSLARVGARAFCRESDGFLLLSVLRSRTSGQGSGAGEELSAYLDLSGRLDLERLSPRQHPRINRLMSGRPRVLHRKHHIDLIAVSLLGTT